MVTHPRSFMLLWLIVFAVRTSTSELPRYNSFIGAYIKIDEKYRFMTIVRYRLCKNIYKL